MDDNVEVIDIANASTSRRQRKKSFIIHRQAREMAKYVLTKCEEEKHSKVLKFTINKALDRGSYYTGLSKSVLCKIKKEPTDEHGRMKSPSRKGKKYPRQNDLNIDDFDRQVIHRCIEEFYLAKELAPTCEKLLVELRDRINFPWGPTSLRKLLKQMGYKWQTCQRNKKILIERPHIFFARTQYLRKILQFRRNNRPIVFISEICIEMNTPLKKCWRDDKMHAMLTDKNTTNSLILVHAGSKHGFLYGAKLIFEAGTTSGAYQGQMNPANFEKWVKQMLIPNLPPNSVVVMDNASYHNIVLENKVPAKSSTKKTMVEWLAKFNVQVDFNMRKDEIYHLIQQQKTPEKSLKIDELLKSYGHDGVRLPPYMSELNPINLAWSKVNMIVRGQNITSLANLRELTEQAIAQITVEDWCGYENHIRVLEDNYWQRDCLMENAIDYFLIDVGEDGDRSSSNSSSDFSDCDID